VIFALESQLSERARKTEDQPWTHFPVSRLVAHSRVPKDFSGSAVSCPRKPSPWRGADAMGAIRAVLRGESAPTCSRDLTGKG